MGVPTETVYVEYNPSLKWRGIFAVIGEYIEESRRDGMLPVDKRGIHYQLAHHKDVEYENTPQDYDNLKKRLRQALDGGFFAFSDLEDNSREIEYASHFTVEDVAHAAPEMVKLDLQAGQPRRLFVIIEKKGLVPVIRGVCRELHVPLHGAGSSKEIRGFQSCVFATQPDHPSVYARHGPRSACTPRSRDQERSHLPPDRAVHAHPRSWAAKMITKRLPPCVIASPPCRRSARGIQAPVRRGAVALI